MAKPYIRIGFIRTERYESEGRNKGPLFSAGEVYDCAREFGERWLNRNVAIELKGAKDPGDERWALVEDSGWTPDLDVPAEAEAEAGPADAEAGAGAEEPAPKPKPAAKPAPAAAAATDKA